VAIASRGWLLIAAPLWLGACAGILGIQPWIPRDGGLGGGGAGGGAGGATVTSSSSTSSTGGSSTSSTSSSSSGDAGVCSAGQPSCAGCAGCAEVIGGACEAAYVACASTTGPGSCDNVLKCIQICGDDSTCIGVCPGQETMTMLFPAYATCLCQQCAPSCASFATALCH
jgi:hypothetical protein